MSMQRSPREILRLLVRRKAQILTVLLLAVIGASVFAALKPRKFTARTRLQAEGISPLDGRRDVEKVVGIQSDVKNQANFDKVVSELNLDAHLQGVPEAERANKRRTLVNDLIKDTRAEVSQPAPGTYVLLIEHTNPSAETAFRIVDALSSRYRADRIDNPIKNQSEVVQSKAEREKRARSELGGINEDLQAFDEKHSEFLEGAEERLENVRGQIEQIKEVNIAGFETEISRLRELEQREPEFIEDTRLVGDSQLIADIKKDLREVERELDRLQIEERKTENHPKVKALLATHANLQEKLALAMAEQKTETVRIPNEMRAHWEKKRQEVEAQLAVERLQLGVLHNKEAELVADAGRAPEIRIERQKLLRAQLAAQKRFEEAEAEHSEARDKLQDVRNQRQLRFDIIEAPARPDKPSGPGALLIALMGLAVGAAAGVGMAYVLDSMDQSFREVDDASMYLGAPTLGAIHKIMTPSELSKVRRKKILVALALLVLACVAGAAVATALLGDPQDIVRMLRR